MMCALEHCIFKLLPTATMKAQAWWPRLFICYPACMHGLVSTPRTLILQKRQCGRLCIPAPYKYTMQVFAKLISCCGSLSEFFCSHAVILQNFLGMSCCDGCVTADAHIIAWGHGGLLFSVMLCRQDTHALFSAMFVVCMYMHTCAVMVHMAVPVYLFFHQEYWQSF